MVSTEPRPPVVALLTDFGVADHYVGVMKAVILTHCPAAVLIDLTHLIPPQDVARGAFELWAATPYLPAGVVVLAVVDPGVGTARFPIALETGGRWFIGPDNGLFTDVAAADGATIDGDRLALGEGQRAWILDVERFARRPISRTFHGRDLFAPVVGYLAARGDPAALGSPTTTLVALSRPSGPHVVAIDHFGNAITSVAATPGARYTVSVGGRTITMTDGSYGDASDAIVLVNSSGRLEIAVPNGSAATALGLRPGDPIDVAATPTIEEST